MDHIKQKVVHTNVSVEQKISWFDRVIIWIDQRPWPVWLSYAGLIFIGEILFNLAFWIDGSVPFGERVKLQSVSIPLVFLSVAFYHYLTKAGSKALQDFRPLLMADDEEIAKIDRVFNYLPSNLGWIVLFIDLVGSYFYVVGSTNTFGDIVPQSFLPASAVYIASVIVIIPFYNQLFRIIRQVRILQDLHQRALNINLLHLAPAHAFAGLTAKIGGGLILLIVLGILYNPELGAGVNLIGIILIIAFAVLIFVAPLIGMRNRLVLEKLQRMKEISELLQSTLDQIHETLINQKNTEVSAAKSTMSALIEERALIEKVSTWPWDTGTIRGFASTLVLPIILWFITNYLSRYF